MLNARAVRTAMRFDRNVAKALRAYFGGRRRRRSFVNRAQLVDWHDNKEIDSGGGDEERDQVI